MQKKKNVKFTSGFFAVLLLREKQKKPFVSTKEPFCFSNVFCIRYFLKTKRKPAEKYREMFSYPFVAHMQKIGKSEQ